MENQIPKNKIYISLGTILLAVLIAGGYFILQLQNIEKSLEDLEHAEHVIAKALDFNVENFHTQLEMWEYAFDPNQTRLLAFKKHQTKLDLLLGDLVESLREEGSTFDGGVDTIDEIRGNVGQVNADWEKMLVGIGELEDLKARGLGEGDEEYEIAEAETAAVVFANEDLFDRLEFNKAVDEFVEQQDEYVDVLQDVLLSPIDRFQKLFFAFLAVMFVLIIGLGAWMSATPARAKGQEDPMETE